MPDGSGPGRLRAAGVRAANVRMANVRMANVIVTEGNLFDTPRIRYVFVAGWPVDIDLPAQNQGGRGGRGGGQ